MVPPLILASHPSVRPLGTVLEKIDRKQYDNESIESIVIVIWGILQTIP